MQTDSRGRDVFSVDPEILEEAAAYRVAPKGADQAEDEKPEAEDVRASGTQDRG
jgi:hypothetical protein